MDLLLQCGAAWRDVPWLWQQCCAIANKVVCFPPAPTNTLHPFFFEGGFLCFCSVVTMTSITSLLKLQTEPRHCNVLSCCNYRAGLERRRVPKYRLEHLLRL
mmetsp:Transcript_8995/g.20020  ORF Transcript_8995/g.20020 Transcript_8995/m.20020 type:complete len:102 (+) Transcript_8995:40-345(+)